MITAGDFKKGITVEWDGGVWTIVDFQHVKPGKGAAFVRTKIKNVMTGAVVERSFNPTDKMPKAIIETKEMQYVYNDGELYYFMDVETYDQIPMSLDKVEDAIPYVKEGTNVTVKFFKGNLCLYKSCRAYHIGNIYCIVNYKISHCKPPKFSVQIFLCLLCRL